MIMMMTTAVMIVIASAFCYWRLYYWRRDPGHGKLQGSCRDRDDGIEPSQWTIRKHRIICTSEAHWVSSSIWWTIHPQLEVVYLGWKSPAWEIDIGGFYGGYLEYEYIHFRLAKNNDFLLLPWLLTVSSLPFLCACKSLLVHLILVIKDEFYLQSGCNVIKVVKDLYNPCL